MSTVQTRDLEVLETAPIRLFIAALNGHSSQKAIPRLAFTRLRIKATQT